MFRTLNASEIECRVGIIKENGLTLLLYKDARADMNILDETVGAERWQRSHEVINGNLHCNVGINFPKEFDRWVWKQDVGTQSFTEKEKGESSDSFKRACVNWGIGRELYTSPFIWVTSSDCNITTKNGKSTTYDKFNVTDIGYNKDRQIIKLVIKNSKTNKVVYTYGKGTVKKETTTKTTRLTNADFDKIVKIAERKGIDYAMLTEYTKKKYDCTFNKINNNQCVEMMKYVSSKEDKKVEKTVSKQDFKHMNVQS